ncbi:hypothetical protein G9A89_007034 [Geosiphon pyriformis]|nr:hypothetical protein G9A89_007034 [Geosiphon pyriformis]
MQSEPATPRIKVFTETHLHFSIPIYFQITVLKESAFVWVSNHGNEVLQNLAVAMPPLPFGGITTSATTILSKEVEETSKQLSQKLARKFKKQFFVSINLAPSNDQAMLMFIEKKIFEFVKEVAVS